MSSLTDTTEIVLLETGQLFKRTISETEITHTLKNMLKKDLINDIALVTPVLMQAPEPELTGGLRFAQLDNCLWSIIEIKAINLNCVWHIEDGVVRPNFRSEGTATINPAIGQKELLLPIPKNAKLFFISLFRQDPNIAERFLVGMITNPDPSEDRNAAYFTPALPNSHEDGRLCTGGHAEITGDTFIQTSLKALDQWVHSRWNNDLNNEERNRKGKALLRWDIETGAYLATGQDWWDYRISLSPDPDSLGGAVMKIIQHLFKEYYP